MTEVLTDERVAAVLRPFVRAAAPVLAALRESDPLRLRKLRTAGTQPSEDVDVSDVAAEDGAGGAANDESPEPVKTSTMRRIRGQLDAMWLPGSSAWQRMTVEQRCDWWVRRVGTFLALLAGLPNFGGVITSRLPLRNALGTAGQGLVLAAIAAEHGIDDRAAQVKLIAEVVFDRELSDELASGRGERARRLDDERTAELTEGLDAKTGRGPARAVARTVWRMARALWEIDAELDKRPQGRLHHEAISSLPVVGVVGGYLGERAALRRAARQGRRWIARRGR